MKKLLGILLVAFTLVGTTNAGTLGPHGRHHSHTKSTTTTTKKTVHVHGYTRKDGTVVHSYTRRAPRHK